MKLHAMMAFICATCAVSTTFAHVMPLENFSSKPILADLKDLKALGFPVLAKDEYAEIGYTIVTPAMQQKIQARAHTVGKCGGFEDLSHDTDMHTLGFSQMLGSVSELKRKDELYQKAPFKSLSLNKVAAIETATQEVSENNLRAYVTWLSSFPSRYNKAAQPNTHVDEMKQRLEAMLGNVSIPYEVDLISHTSTDQKTIRVRLPGKEKPQEIIVLGGHLDSIAGSGWGGGGGSSVAPGADDNASGSANLIETLRIISLREQPKRTIEFFWYAGEESGLLGSAEVAKQYKAEQKDVIAVMQLDMTLFPGSGELVMANMNDFTSSWLRDYIKELNGIYVNARMIDDKCGYGCSDHASWYRQGYPAVMPAESAMSKMNSNIHTKNDVIGPQSNFKHSAAFTRLAIAFAMDLGNNGARQPY